MSDVARSRAAGLVRVVVAVSPEVLMASTLGRPGAGGDQPVG